MTTPSKSLDSSADLALAYSPGVAYACQAIHNDPSTVNRYTMKRHLVAVISNGTAVLGLGDIGPLASKPVMEGKAVLFQHFAGLNAIDLEIQETDPQALIETIARLAPTFGAINLEDIKSPECFEIEEALSRRLDIPVFHDDQHGTAVTVCAAVLNALVLVNKKPEDVRLVIAGAGAGALACAHLLEDMGVQHHHIAVVDSKGLIHCQRSDLTDHKKRYAHTSDHRTLGDALQGADIFLGLSVGKSVTPSMIQSMAPHPIVFALANPEPEIWPSDVHSVRPDAVVGTGRSDLPNQINNVLCFPYIFRGAIDALAPTITLNMKKACVKALQNLARQGCQETLLREGHILDFGPSYFVPKPFDRRLGVDLPLAVAKAACEDFPHLTLDATAYKHQLMHRAYGKRSLFFMQRMIHATSLKAIPEVVFRMTEASAMPTHSLLSAIVLLKKLGLAMPVVVAPAVTSASPQGESWMQDCNIVSDRALNPNDITIEVTPDTACTHSSSSGADALSLWHHHGEWWAYGTQPQWLETLLTSWGYNQPHASDPMNSVPTIAPPSLQWRGCAFPLTDQKPTIGPLSVNQSTCVLSDSVEHILEVACLALWRKEACSAL